MKVVLAFLKAYWYLIPMVILGFTLAHTREQLADKTATLNAERKSWEVAGKLAAEQKKTDEARYTKNQDDGLLAYVARQKNQEPIIVKETNIVREYEKTDAGHVQCIDATWVQQLKDHRRALFPENP